jgi:hypothetical protein
MDTYHNKIFKKNVNQTIENKPSFLSNLLNNSNPNTTNNNNKSNNSRIFSSESSSFKTPSSNIFSNPYQNTQNKNNEFKKEIENKNQNNNNKNESNLSKTKNYISNAMSSFGSFIKGFVNMEPDTMNKFRNSNEQKQDIAFSALDISNHTNNLNFLLQKYKDNMSEEDINRFEFTIKFLRTAGRCVPSYDDNK